MFRFLLVVSAFMALSYQAEVDLDKLFSKLNVEEKCGQMTQVAFELFKLMV